MGFCPLTMFSVSHAIVSTLLSSWPLKSTRQKMGGKILDMVGLSKLLQSMEKVEYILFNLIYKVTSH